MYDMRFFFDDVDNVKMVTGEVIVKTFSSYTNTRNPIWVESVMLNSTAL
jgi:hypothetical protein